jgi:hypothetical protein
MRFQLPLVQLKLIPLKQRLQDNPQLHDRHVLAHTRPRAVRERIKRLSLPLRQMEPAIGFEAVDIVAPDLRQVVDRVLRDGEHRASGEMARVEIDARGRGHDPWQPQGGRRVQTHAFIDAALQEGEVLDALILRDEGELEDDADKGIAASSSC